MTTLKGTTRTGLILVSAIFVIISLSFLVQYGQSVYGGTFVVANITANNSHWGGAPTAQQFATSNAGVNVTFFESGMQNVTINISLKILDSNGTTGLANGAGSLPITGINITLPSGFTLRPEILYNASLNTSTNNVSAGNFSNIRTSNETFGGRTNLTYVNASGFGGAVGGFGGADGGSGFQGWNGTLLNTSGTGWFAFWVNVPSGRAKANLGNNSMNITVTVIAGSILTSNFAITLHINDTIAPTTIRLGDPSNRANNTNTTNTTNDFLVTFNETNPSWVNLSVGFANGSLVNKSMTVINPSSTNRATLGNATLSVAGLPDGKHNYTFYVTDVDNNQALNSTSYITTDATSPVVTITNSISAGGIDKSASVSATDLTCSASDATSGLPVTSFSMSITKPTGTVVTHTCGNAFTDTADVGDYSISFTQTDYAGNSASATSTFKVKYPQNTGSTSGSTTPSSPSLSATVLATKTLTVTEATTSAKPVDFTVPIEVSSKAAVTKISIEVSKDVSAVDSSVEVKALDKLPINDDKGQTLTALPSADQPVLKVIQMTPSTALSAAVTKATVSFSLTKAELGDRLSTDIVLARFANGAWNELATTAGAVKADGSVDFTAETPGFSTFVVTTKAPAVASASPTPVTSATPTPKSPAPSVAPTTATPTPAPKPAGGLSDTLLYAIVGIIVVIVIVVVVLTAKKKR